LPKTEDKNDEENPKQAENNKKKKKRVQTKKEENEEEDFEPIEEKICRLCNRTVPVFFFQNDDQVKRLPERVLTPLLLDLKSDMEKKMHYLRFLKVSTKFIDACNCTEQLHSYCLSALVTRTKKIYCPICHEHYKYWIKEEKVCNTKLIKLVASYVLFFLTVLLFTWAIMVLDAFLKDRNQVQSNQDQSFWQLIRWNFLIAVSAVVLLILAWSFYYTY
jgi:hypothetical protein